MPIEFTASAMTNVFREKSGNSRKRDRLLAQDAILDERQTGGIPSISLQQLSNSLI